MHVTGQGYEGWQPTVFGNPYPVIGISDTGPDRPRLETWCLHEGSENRRGYVAEWLSADHIGHGDGDGHGDGLKPPTDAAGHQPRAVVTAADPIENAETEVDPRD
jgi:hypothetical protein